VKQQLKSIKDLLSSLEPKCGESAVITIDGPAGSGKTTLARILSSELASSYTVHMDDLYNGWESTLTPKLSSKLREIMREVRDNSQVIFAVFDWIENSQKTEVHQPAPRYLIVEGVGSGQSAIRDFVSLALWIEVPVEEGLARVIKRDGPSVTQYMPAFLAAQNSHFEKEETRKWADKRLSGLGTV
jgi:uridine kinase